MLLRIRTKVATWRLEGMGPTTTIAEVRERLNRDHHVTPTAQQYFSTDPLGKKAVRDNDTLGGLGFRHGDMLYFHIQEGDCAAELGKKISADGSIVNKTYEEVSKEHGFRPGLMSLRSMKMHWTLADFVELDSQFEFKIKRQEKAFCTKVSMEGESGNSFQSYMRILNFGQCRVGYLYGSFEEDNSVRVEAMYEPPQEGSPTSFTILEDPMGDKVEELAKMLGMKRVGWIFAHPPREEHFLFTHDEVVMAAIGQLEAAQGINDTPYVTVRVSIDGEGQVHYDAFQVSTQCMQMVADGAVVAYEEPGASGVPSTFTAIVEGKPSKKIDNNFFLAPVAIEQHNSTTFVSTFPKFNRTDNMPTRDAMKAQLSKAGKAGWTFLDQLADFHLLLFLSEYLDLHTDLSIIASSIKDRSIPLAEGHVELIRNIAGM